MQLLDYGIIVLAISWFIWIFVCKSKKSLPPLPPGPLGLPLVGNLLFLDSELHSYFASLSQIYGPILTLKLGNKVGIVINSPAIASEVLKDNDVTFANRDVPIAGKEATYGGLDIAWTPYGPKWRMLRKVCVHKLLSNTTLDSVYALRRKEVRQTIRYLYSRMGSSVNVGEQTFLCTFNVTTNMLWGGTLEGVEMGSLGKKRDTLGAEFQHLVGELIGLLGKPNLSDFFPSLARFDLQGIQKHMKGLVQRFDQIFDTMIDQRLKLDGQAEFKEMNDCNKNNDFLQFLLELTREGDGKTSLTMENLKALLMDMITGGTDTTSNAVEFAMAEIMNKPEIMKKVQEELETVVGKEKMVEESHIPKLSYLQAVMKETLRLHTVLPLLIPHCPSQPCIVGGYTIPKGARIFINAWAIHRDPSIWERPLEFDPERFLNSKWDYSGNDFRYFPFGSGRRICAGTAMAERMFMFSLASLMHSFDWKLPEGDKMDLSEKFGIVMKKKIPLVAIPTPRLSDPALYE